MKKVFFFVTALYFLTALLPLSGQNIIPNKSVSGVCYAGTQVNKMYVPPPDQFFRKSGRKLGASITVYYSGFSAQAKTAVEYAKTILESILPAGTKITMLASWEKISTAGVLGNTTVTGFAHGAGIDALNPNVLYPVALAEKIAGISLNPDLQGDLELRINSSINWYLGTDGQPPVQNYDLVTVVLHEICHGLGFYDSMNTDATTGSYGFSSFPMIYDSFIENAAGKRLIDTLQFKNNTAALRNELLGGQLWFNGPVLIKNSSKAKVYAPPVWDGGSSISHLDESSTLKEYALMTPFINLQEAIHNPGKITVSILGDLGWINTRIIHKPLGDTENHLTQVVLSTEIKSDTSYNRNKVGVVYSLNKFKTKDTVYMTPTGAINTFSASVNIPTYNTDLLYYFFAEDYFRRIYRSPSLSDVIQYHMFIGTDIVKPVITHTPEKFFLESVDTIKFSALATDNLGIDTVFVEYKVNNGTSAFIGLKTGKTDNYNGLIKARGLNLNGGDSIRYRIFASDKASVPNTVVLPKTGYFATVIEDIGTVVDNYSTDFTKATSDFFNIGFNIQKPDGFANFGLHTRHPYESPEDNNKSIEYTSLLRRPVKLKESGLLISFSEVVLVEPGETGSTFGSSDFYDYVIIEGSKNSGRSWFKFADGYDCRFIPLWENSYNSSKVGQNSVYPGSESMLRKHSVYISQSDNIAVGDTLLIRFRLFSDPYANGWGWVIEDLKINPLIDAVEKLDTNGKLLVYPNPGSGLIRFTTENLSISPYKQLKYSVYNSSGTCILKDILHGGTEDIIDITGYPSGIYLIVLYPPGGIKTFKYSLIK